MPHYVNIATTRTGRGFLWSQASDTRPQPQLGAEFCRLERADDGAITIVVFDPAVMVIAEERPERSVPDPAGYDFVAFVDLDGDDDGVEEEETPW